LFGLLIKLPFLGL